MAKPSRYILGLTIHLLNKKTETRLLDQGCEQVWSFHYSAKTGKVYLGWEHSFSRWCATQPSGTRHPRGQKKHKQCCDAGRTRYTPKLCSVTGPLGVFSVTVMLAGPSSTVTPVSPMASYAACSLAAVGWLTATLFSVTPERGRLLRGCRRSGSASAGLPRWIRPGRAATASRPPRPWVNWQPWGCGLRMCHRCVLAWGRRSEGLSGKLASGPCFIRASSYQISAR